MVNLVNAIYRDWISFKVCGVPSLLCPRSKK